MLEDASAEDEIETAISERVATMVARRWS